MSTLYDGDPNTPLTYGQALVLLAQQVAWPTSEARDEVVRAVQTEHDLLPPEPDEDPTEDDQDRELRELRAEAARRARDEEIAQLRAQLAGSTPAESDSSVSSTPAPGQV